MNRYLVYLETPSHIQPAYEVVADEIRKEYDKDSEWSYAYSFKRKGEVIAIFPTVLAIVREDAGNAPE